MRMLALSAATALLVGCAQVKFADGERVAIEHETQTLADIQPQADQACVQSGGRAPAVLISSIPVSDFMPASMVRKVATFRCAK